MKPSYWKPKKEKKQLSWRTKEKRLKAHGHYVVGADLKYPEFSTTQAHEFHIGDLRLTAFANEILNNNFHLLYIAFILFMCTR